MHTVDGKGPLDRHPSIFLMPDPINQTLYPVAVYLLLFNRACAQFNTTRERP
jgi:hypothetical protein